MTTHCFSVDVETYVEASIDSYPDATRFLDPRRDGYELEANVDAILEVLANLGVRGTWFFLGRIAIEAPALVRKVADLGHEIGCHGMRHRRLYLIDPGLLPTELTRARRTLEDVGGAEVVGFRAPDFSVVPKSRWALDAIAEAGFVYDSSLVPTNLHDVYGMPGTEPTLHHLPNGLVEFPVSTFSVGVTRLPWAGGGYFRILPLAVTRGLLRWADRRGQPMMFYIHPYEVGPVLSDLPILTALRKFRHEFRAGRRDRLERLLKGFHFSPAREIVASFASCQRAGLGLHV